MKASSQACNSPANPSLPRQGEIVPAPETLFIPRNQFYAGHNIGTVIFSSLKSGDLTFVVEPSFRSRKGQGYFEWQITINGKCYLKCDGAATNAPTTVKICELPPVARVEVVLHVHRDSPRASWEAASRINVKELRFLPSALSPKGQITVSTNNRQVIALGTKVSIRE